RRLALGGARVAADGTVLLAGGSGGRRAPQALPVREPQRDVGAAALDDADRRAVAGGQHDDIDVRLARADLSSDGTRHDEPILSEDDGRPRHRQRGQQGDVHGPVPAWTRTIGSQNYDLRDLSDRRRLEATLLRVGL